MTWTAEIFGLLNPRLWEKNIYLILLKNGNEYLWVLSCVCSSDIIPIVDLKESKT